MKQRPTTDEQMNIDLSNNSAIESVLKNSGKPWIWDVMEAMEDINIDAEQMLQALYLLKNVQRLSGWGKVTYLIQDKKITRIVQEQGFKRD